MDFTVGEGIMILQLNYNCVFLLATAVILLGRRRQHRSHVAFVPNHSTPAAPVPSPGVHWLWFVRSAVTTKPRLPKKPPSHLEYPPPINPVLYEPCSSIIDRRGGVVLVFFENGGVFISSHTGVRNTTMHRWDLTLYFLILKSWLNSVPARNVIIFVNWYFDTSDPPY